MRSPEGRLARWRREPLLHFLALGAALFALFAVIGRDGDPATRRIVVDPATVESLAAGFRRTWQRAPTPAELEGLVAEHVREEVLVREATALGLDRDDPIVRRRLRQKLELLAEGIGGGDDEPSDGELAAYQAAHVERYRVEPRVDFRQVYVSGDRRGAAAAAADAERLLARLRAGDVADPAALGDPIPLPAALRDVPLSEAGRHFGEAFAARLATLPVGQWVGPVASGFGLHLVLVEAREPARTPALAEVREAVLRDWRAARSEAAVESFYRSLLETYTVVVEQREPVSGVAAAEDTP